MIEICHKNTERQVTTSIYLAHLNPVTKAHVEIIEELKNENQVRVLPVIFMKDGKEINSRSFPFSYELRKKMLKAVFGDSITIAPDYTFYAPFAKYMPPMLSPYSWKIKKQILNEVNCQQQQKAGKDDPGKRFAERDWSQTGGRRKMCGSAHEATLLEGNSRPRARRQVSGPGLTFGFQGPITVARPRRTSTGFRSLKQCAHGRISRGTHGLSTRQRRFAAALRGRGRRNQASRTPRERPHCDDEIKVRANF